jgi:PKD repeat protein
MRPSTKAIIVILFMVLVGWSGCTEKKLSTVVENAENIPPSVFISANPTTGYQPLAVSFHIDAEDSDGLIASCIIDFGDGTTGNESNNTHVYKYGSYTATVTVKDDQDAEAKDSIAIDVKNHLPTIAIQTNTTTGEAPLNITFSGIANDLDGMITTWSWDFGDGTHADTSNVTRVFATPGRYTIKVTITDNDGETATAQTDITVEPAKADWQITLKGATTVIMTRKQFEQLVDVYGQDWSDGDNTWHGVPLWHLIAIVDDKENTSNKSLSNYSFNDTLADKGYTVKITAGDGFVITLRSQKTAHEDGYLVTNTVDGNVLPARTPRDRPSWPLHMRGDKAHQPYNIGNIITIELVGLNEGNSLLSYLLHMIQMIKEKMFNSSP